MALPPRKMAGLFPETRDSVYHSGLRVFQCSFKRKRCLDTNIRLNPLRNMLRSLLPAMGLVQVPELFFLLPIREPHTDGFGRPREAQS